MVQFFQNLWQKLSVFFNRIYALFAAWLSTQEIKTPPVEPKKTETLSFPEVTAPSITPSGHLKNEKQSCDEIRFNEMINHIRELLGNLIAIESAYEEGFPYLKRTFGANADFELDISLQTPALFSALRKVLSPMYVHQATKYWFILYFDSKIAKDHPLWSEEGRLQAFHKIYDLLVEDTLVMGGRLGQNTKIFYERYPNFSPEQVKNLLAMHFNQSRQRFMQTTDMEEKRAILLEIAKSYNPIRDDYNLFSKIVLNQACQLKLLMLYFNRKKDVNYPIDSHGIEDYLIGQRP
jgi:hypothetical protein